MNWIDFVPAVLYGLLALAVVVPPLLHIRRKERREREDYERMMAERRIWIEKNGCPLADLQVLKTD